MGNTNNTVKTKKASGFLIAAVIIFVIGALLFCGGMFALNWNFNKLDVSNYTANSWTGDGDIITSLDLNISGRDVTVNAIEEGEANITWFDSDSERVSVSVSQGKLTIKEKYFFVFGPLFSFGNNEKDQLIINIPVNSLEKLQVKHSGGSLNINGIETVNKIEYRQSGGSADLGGIQQTDSLSYDGSGGSIKLSNLKANSIVFDQSGGSAYLNYVETKTFTCDGQSGGRLSLKELIVDKFDIKMSGGTITGSINGQESDYAVSVSKSGGRCNIKEKDGTVVSQKWIKVKQSGGTVNLSFEILIILN